MGARTFICRIAVLACVCSGLALPAWAQGVGAIGGIVADASGAVLPGATVTLSNPGTIGGNRDTVSDERGAYQFTRLVPGTYSVRAEMQGFRPAIQNGVVVNADATGRVDLKLDIGGVEEGIIVSGAAPLIDTTSTLNQAVMSREVLDSLPARNDLWSIGRTIPGVLINKYDVGGSESYQQSNTTVHGSSADENAYLIDGMDVSWTGGTGASQMIYFDPHMFEEINYQTGNPPAERSKGGVLFNMITKTGSNAFRGAYTFSGANHGMGFSNISPDLRTQLVAAIPARVLAANPNIVPGADILNIFDTAATLSGPIIKDRLWFVSAGKWGKLNQYRLGSYDPDGRQVLDDNRMRNASYKLSWQANHNHQLSYLYDWNNKSQFHRTGNATTEFADSRSMYRQDQYGAVHQGKWTAVLSQKIVADVSASIMHGGYPSPPQPEVKPGDIPRFDSVLRNHTVAAPTYTDNPMDRRVFLSGFTYAEGRHEIKVGYQFVRAMFGTSTYSTSHYPAGLQAVFRNGVPDSVNTYNTPTHYVQYSHDHAVFVQDKWAASRRLTLNVGLRFETTYGWQPATCQVETIFIKGQCFPEIKGAPDFKDLAPRLSAIYDIFGNGRTALKFSANRYNIPINIANVVRINPVQTTSDTRSWTDANFDLIPQLDELGASTGFNLGTTNRYSDTLGRPRSIETSIELEHQLPWDLVASTGYYRRGTRHNIGSTNRAVPRESYTPLEVTETSSGRKVTVYNQAPALRGQFDVLWDNRPELDTQFNGVDMTVTKRMSHGWMLMSGASFGRNVGDIFSTSDLNNPNFMFRDGIIGNDVPVSLRASGRFELPYAFSISGSVQHFAGFPENTTVLVGSDTVRLTQVSQSLVVEPRGTTRLPSVDQLDLSFRRTLKAGGLKAEPTFDVFNVLNGASIVARTTQLGPAYGRSANIQRGRLIRAGVNITF